MKSDPLDKLFSQYIRMRAIIRVGGCERCFSPKFDIEKDNGKTFPAWKQLQCSHFIGRGKRSVRFDSDNAIGICGGCHMYLTSHPLLHVEFFKQRLGEIEFDLLNARAHIPTRYLDKNTLSLYYKAKIKEMPA